MRKRFALFVFCLLALCPLSAQTEIRLYQNGADKFEALLHDMQEARHHIHCEYFIFADDSNDCFVHFFENSILCFYLNGHKKRAYPEIVCPFYKIFRFY